MGENHKTVFGLYKTRPAAENGVRALKKNGFERQQVSLLLPQGCLDIIQKKGNRCSNGLVTGVGVGALLGGVFTLLTNIGILSVPGFFLKAEALTLFFAGLGAGGVVGGFCGALLGVGISEHEIKRFENVPEENDILISIHSENSKMTVLARSILEDTGAEDIDVTAEHCLDDEIYANLDSFPDKASIYSDLPSEGYYRY